MPGSTDLSELAQDSRMMHKVFSIRIREALHEARMPNFGDNGFCPATGFRSILYSFGPGRRERGDRLLVIN